MTFNPDFHHRRSIRLEAYDYSRPGFYFITLCIQDRLPLFGTIVDGKIMLDEAGFTIEKWWLKLPEKFSGTLLDEYIIMPNHMHGVVQITGADLCVRPGSHVDAPLHRMIQWFKTMSTNEYLRGIKCERWRPFHARLWQRDYYERIVRDEQELSSIREYIRNNPLQWALDEMYVM